MRLQQIDPADERDLNTLNEWLWDREDGGRAFLHDDSVKGPEYDASTKDLYEEAKDLIPLAPRPGEKDAFTRFLMGPLLEFLNDKFLYRLRVCPLSPQTKNKRKGSEVVSSISH